jgi:predicted NUDIX family NTP pyrophosphohydrolase
VGSLTINSVKIAYPKSSGEFIEFPEMDRYEFFSALMAKNKINPSQIHLIDKLEQIIFAEFNYQRII